MKEKKAFRWRMALYALVLLLFYVLQTARGTRLHVFGATPDLMPFFLAAIALFEGPYVGRHLALPWAFSPRSIPGQKKG